MGGSTAGVGVGESAVVDSLKPIVDATAGVGVGEIDVGESAVVGSAETAVDAFAGPATALTVATSLLVCVNAVLSGGRTSRSSLEER
jgi:hypothetical protein